MTRMCGSDRGQCDTELVSVIEARLWRAVHRSWWVLLIGVLGLLLGLGSGPTRAHSLFGPFIVLVAVLPPGAIWMRLPTRTWSAVGELLRGRVLLTATTGLLACAAILVLCWAVGNAVNPGTLSPLSLALLGVVAAGATTLLGRLSLRD